MNSAAPPRLRSALFHALRALFRVLPIGDARRDRWRQRFLDRFPRIRPAPARGHAVAGHARRPRVHAGGRAIGYVEYRVEPLPQPLPATLVAFYLPQFHTIPENDAWWGKGFTEWRNVARALPQFEGHAQPRLPGDLGFYDLRNPQVMRDQARLAREYGIGAFCFYFYWFGGRTLLEAPLQQWLDDPSIDLPFCLCWANENWSRRWDGRADDVLIAQSHSAEDDLAFIAHVSRYLRDPRYLRHDGKPLLLVYRPGLLPDAAASAARWRAWCRDNGIGEIHIACVQSFESIDPRRIGFDAAVEFPPNLATPASLSARQRLLNPDFHGDVVDWRELARDYETRPLAEYPLFPGVNCGWDNEPRRAGQGRIYAHASPHRYGQWLQQTIAGRMGAVAPHRRLVFINAWNEWAEGAVLEPDARLGHAWLQATRQALVGASLAAAGRTSAARPCAVIHAWYPEVLPELLDRLQASGLAWRTIITTSMDKASAVRACLANSGMQAEVEIVANRGRDVLPFLEVAHRLLEEGESIVLKLHTKRSTHRADGDAWRDELIGRLLERADALFALMCRDERIGMVGPAGHVLPLAAFTGANAKVIAYLNARLGLDVAADDTLFVAGSMFWLRLEALRPVLDAHLHADEFECEHGQTDGTLAHGLERVLAAAAAQAGWSVSDTATLLGQPTPDAAFRYARRD